MRETIAMAFVFYGLYRMIALSVSLTALMSVALPRPERYLAMIPSVIATWLTVIGGSILIVVWGFSK